ncbi:hypothetical protein K435DRAFT_879115 [Dendrothele bispora CBS 962.96]|uniref:Uncharacterized protein n=1 Tax=Dendrothele bispora (strain CBS 962.96) TaxID=1314807 RepID=A0A4S8KLV8_DENBC|nr:hypothetical protein K435DRAFT_879115 [Dendrothele bispora CBS 962.96]
MFISNKLQSILFLVFALVTVQITARTSASASALRTFFSPHQHVYQPAGGIRPLPFEHFMTTSRTVIMQSSSTASPPGTGHHSGSKTTTTTSTGTESDDAYLDFGRFTAIQNLKVINQKFVKG